jgi:hypothetical protein
MDRDALPGIRIGRLQRLAAAQAVCNVPGLSRAA